MEQQQFVVVGAAALVTEHSIVHEVGHDRPDKRDWRQIDEFVSQIKIKLGKAQEGQALSPIHVKGNQPFRNYNGIPLKPKANKECVSCGFCGHGNVRLMPLIRLIRAKPIKNAAYPV